GAEGGDERGDEAPPETDWDEAAMARALAACRSEQSRAEVESIAAPGERAMALLFHMNYYPTRFSERPRLYREQHARRPRLDLPFRAEDYDGVVFPGVPGPEV